MRREVEEGQGGQRAHGNGGGGVKEEGGALGSNLENPTNLHTEKVGLAFAIEDHARLGRHARKVLKNTDSNVRYGKSGVRHMGEMGAVGE